MLNRYVGETISQCGFSSCNIAVVLAARVQQLAPRLLMRYGLRPTHPTNTNNRILTTYIILLSGSEILLIAEINIYFIIYLYKILYFDTKQAKLLSYFHPFEFFNNHFYFFNFMFTTFSLDIRNCITSRPGIFKF